MTRSAEYPVKFFMNGRSQAVRLPKELRLEAVEGIAYRDGESIVIRPAGTWPKGYFGSWKALDPSFVAPERPAGETLNDRLDTLFGKRQTQPTGSARRPRGEHEGDAEEVKRPGGPPRS